LEEGHLSPAGASERVAPWLRRVVPWLQRAAERVGLGPVGLGLALALGLSGLFTAAELALGRYRLLSALPAGELRDVRLAFVNFLLVGYAPAAYLRVVYGSRRRVEALRPLLAPDDAAAAALSRAAGSYPRAELWAAGVLGVAAALLVPLLAQGGEYVYRPSTWSFEVAWHRLTAPFIGWWMGRFVYVVLAESGRFSQLAARLPDVDPLDLRPLEVFARQGLAHVLLTAGFVSILALFLFESGFGVMFAVVGVANLGVSAAGLLLPMAGARLRIRAAKQAELDELRPRLVRARAELRAPAGSGGRLADLLAYRALVESVREWPFDASILARFGLYLLIPLGSWLGGALVERVVDRLFD
jgi:hypothetical protein